MEHPLGFHERLGVSRNVGAVVAEYLDACDFRAEADKPCARTRCLEFNQVDGVALEQAKHRTHAGYCQFAIGISELFHAEHAGKQKAIAVFHDAAGACVEGVSGEECVHAVGPHVGNHVS